LLVRISFFSVIDILLTALGFVNDHALILYVYLENHNDPGAEESVLTVSLVYPVLYSQTH